MRTENYCKKMNIDASAKRLFDAFSKELGDWWGNSHEGVSQIGDTMTIGFEENPSQWVFEAQELMEGKRIVLKCLLSDHQHEGLPGTIQQEWKGSQLIWEFKPIDGMTEVSFTHLGLTPELECFNVCEQGWDHYLGEGITRYLKLKS